MYIYMNSLCIQRKHATEISCKIHNIFSLDTAYALLTVKQQLSCS